ncbi:hypothetical protein [Winogradskyella sp. UBA3174]|uniref:hypothetical protein n=1 Tax=Winogradskyella sp. UBA3174 TaxID=1947785 RepID=UPI0025CE5B5D|nr:hypothetical protein [Winogradskyella sp. UBA3174]|tara:strand:+ start:1846 stop:2808 length:963 start_codon:yes stop_codon:yes gene_type:complete
MNSKKRVNITDYLKRKNVKRFSLFFIIAFVFLIFSKLSNDYKQTIKLKLNLVNVEDEIILQNDSLNTINAFIEAKGFAFVPLLFKNYKDIILDAKTDLVSKQGYFIFDVQKNKFLIENQLGESYKLLSVKPDSILLKYSKRASKLIPIVLKSDINFAIGYDVKGDYKLDVDSLKVVGSAKEVNKLMSMTTELLSLKGINANINEQVNIDVSQYSGIEVFPKSVNVSAIVTRFTEGKVNVPVTIINKPKTIEINHFPKTVTLSFYAALEAYSSIKANDFIVECDYLDISENQTYLVPKIIKKPDVVKRINMKQKRIDFIKL